MKIPKRLKIGNLTYSVEELTDSNQTHFGKASRTEQKIWIAKNLPSEDRKIMTLFHEITHVILDDASYESESSNEKIVDLISSGFYQVLKENNLLK